MCVVECNSSIHSDALHMSQARSNGTTYSRSIDMQPRIARSKT